jgi:hypothetical protein
MDESKAEESEQCQRRIPPMPNTEVMPEPEPVRVKNPAAGLGRKKC